MRKHAVKVSTKMTVVLALLVTVIGMTVTALPATATNTTTTQASDEYPYCVLQAQNAGDRKDAQSNGATCYDNYDSYSNDINTYANFVATMYTGTSYTGWRLAIVSQHGCLDGGAPYDKYVSNLEGTGFRYRISSSKVYGTYCTYGLAFPSPTYCGGTLGPNFNFGSSANGGYYSDWSAHGASNQADSLWFTGQVGEFLPCGG